MAESSTEEADETDYGSVALFVLIAAVALGRALFPSRVTLDWWVVLLLVLLVVVVKMDTITEVILDRTGVTIRSKARKLERTTAEIDEAELLRSVEGAGRDESWPGEPPPDEPVEPDTGATAPPDSAGEAGAGPVPEDDAGDAAPDWDEDVAADAEPEWDEDVAADAEPDWDGDAADDGSETFVDDVDDAAEPAGDDESAAEAEMGASPDDETTIDEESPFEEFLEDDRKYGAAEAPADEPADETPADEPADETPADEPADETPADVPVDEAADETTFGDMAPPTTDSWDVSADAAAARTERAEDLRHLAASDPEVAVVDAAADVEAELRELLTAADVHPEGRVATPDLLSLLAAEDLLTGSIRDAIADVWEIRNEVVHGARVSTASAERVVDATVRLLDTLGRYREAVETSERGLLARIVETPGLVEPGFEIEETAVRFGDREVDAVGRARDGTTVLVEVRRRPVTAGLVDRLSSLGDEWTRRTGEETVRVVVVAPDVADGARRTLSSSDVEFRTLRPARG